MWNETQLNDALSTPSDALVRDMASLKGDIIILGAGGKVGPTLCAMAKRAVKRSGVNRKVIAVSRFSDVMATEFLKNEGVEMISADLTDDKQVAALPWAQNIVFMAGRKFGTAGNACETWEMNVAVPTLVTRHFGGARYVVFSTSNVYPFTSVDRGGCDESVPPAPIGEYAMSCLGRERVFESAVKRYGADIVLFRLSYAVDLRYGILYDICRWIMNNEPVKLGVPAFNCVWQRYANEAALRSLSLTHKGVNILNVTGPEIVSVRQAATKLAALLGRKVEFEGTEGASALLTNSQKCVELFGYPDIGMSELMRMQAQWVINGGRQLGKPTHFEESKGNF